MLDKVNEIIEYYGLKNKSRAQELVYKRHFLMNYLKENTGLTLFDISLIFGKADHTIVVYSVNRHNALKNDKTYKYHTDVLKDMLKTKEVIVTDEKTLIERVLACENYWEMKQLQIELTKEK